MARSKAQKQILKKLHVAKAKQSQPQLDPKKVFLSNQVYLDDPKKLKCSMMSNSLMVDPNDLFASLLAFNNFVKFFFFSFFKGFYH